MQIGLIGDIGPAATDFYCWRLIGIFAQKRAQLEMTIAHGDTPTLLDNLSRNQAATQAEIFANLTERLAAASAGCVAVTSIAGHFCRKEFETLSSLPVIDMVDEVGRVVAARGIRRIGIMGTRTVMENRFYGGRGYRDGAAGCRFRSRQGMTPI
jgi:aspartate racemase